MKEQKGNTRKITSADRESTIPADSSMSLLDSRVSRCLSPTSQHFKTQILSFQLFITISLEKKTQDQDMKTKPNISINVTSVFLIN